MLIGNPDKFSFLFEPVPEWSSGGFVNGLLYIYVNGRQFPETLRTTTLSDDLFYLTDSLPFNKPQMNTDLFLLEKRELFTNLCKITFPDLEDGIENDYSYELPLVELQDAGYHFFMIASEDKLRILAGRYSAEGQFDFIDEAVLAVSEFNCMKKQVYDYYIDHIRQNSSSNFCLQPDK